MFSHTSLSKMGRVKKTSFVFKKNKNLCDVNIQGFIFQALGTT
jgi:hypothetical protein